jgi:hypothetical protein
VSAPVVMVLRGQANGQATPYDGQFLKDFDFEAGGGVGEIAMTADVQEAKHFATVAEAIEFRNRQPECKPLRWDGLPNRPLTATHWEVVGVERVLQGNWS